jgi:hypothetical protein
MINPEIEHRWLGDYASQALSQSQWRTDMLMLDRRTLLRAGSAAIAVGAAALAPTAPALARDLSVTGNGGTLPKVIPEGRPPDPTPHPPHLLG